MDEGLKAQTCKAGTELETKEAYGRSLIQDGLAKEIAEPKPKRTPASKKAAGTAKKTVQTNGKKSGPGNPFLA
jgi:hypothetical protein